MAAATHAAAVATSFQAAVAGRTQVPSSDFNGLPLRSDCGRGNLLKTRRSSVWSPLDAQRGVPVCSVSGSKKASVPARVEEVVSVTQVAESIPAKRPEAIASVEVAPPLAYVSGNSQQYIPAMLVGAALAAGFYAIFGNKNQAPAPAFAGSSNGNGALQAVASPPAAPTQPIVIKIEPQMMMPPSAGSSYTQQPQETVEQPKDATRKARDVMSKYFQIVQKDVDFLQRVSETLEQLGFNKNNSIALVDACRDEITRGLVHNIDKIYGESFNISGLGGYVNCGKTGLKAGMAHSPTLPDRDQNGKIREKYIFFAFPHVAVSADGSEGLVQRIGRDKISSACGALLAIQGEAQGWSGDKKYDDDAEYTILRNKVLHKHSCNCNMQQQGPSLMDITKTALDVITEDLNELLSKVVDPENADFAVITGIQIHAGTTETPDGVNQFVDYVAPGSMYAVVNGQAYSLDWRWENGRVVSKKMTAPAQGEVPAALVGARN